jgi:hypothetical protein
MLNHEIYRRSGLYLKAVIPTMVVALQAATAGDRHGGQKIVGTRGRKYSL